MRGALYYVGSLPVMLMGLIANWLFTRRAMVGDDLPQFVGPQAAITIFVISLISIGVLRKWLIDPRVSKAVISLVLGAIVAAFFGVSVAVRIGWREVVPPQHLMAVGMGVLLGAFAGIILSLVMVLVLFPLNYLNVTLLRYLGQIAGSERRSGFRGAASR